MSPCAMRCSAQTLAHPSFSSRLACNPAFLRSNFATTLRFNWPHLQRSSQSTYPLNRSVAPNGLLQSRHVDGFEYGQSGLPIDLENLISSRRRPSDNEWNKAIESYLPPNLRLGFGSDNGDTSDPLFLKPVASLPQVFAAARQQSKIDILSYMGVYQGRWEAVLWLVKALMEQYVSRRDRRPDPEHLYNMLWPSDGRDLDELTYEVFEVDSLGMSRISLESAMQSRGKKLAIDNIPWEHQCLGQIWQSLGIMILQAADCPPNDPKYSVIMFQVFRILGHLHHVGAFPDSIYNYTPPADSTVLQRPPTLHLLSKRIMSTLSDVEFNLQWKDEILKYQQQGYELADAAMSPKLREFGPELWLDLVLWACVEGGWIAGGAWIIGEMGRRRSSPEQSWSVISWQEICARKAPELNLASVIRLQIDKARLNQVGSIGIATGTDFTVDMGTRTVSREVVLAIMDGLLNTAGTSSWLPLQISLSNCRDLLGQERPGLDANLLNAAILRIVEGTRGNGGDAPGVLQRILEFRPNSGKRTVPPESLLSAQNVETDDTASYLGLLHRNLSFFAEKGNLSGSLGTIAKIIDLVDKKRSHRIEDFVNGRKDMSDDLMRNSPGSISTISPQIPVTAVAAFLDLITESRLYFFGRWLLLNEDLDGGILDQNMYANPNLQPALLRFATATADDKLLVKILTYIESPIPEPILHALLHCQIVLGKWPAIQEILQLFRDTPRLSWNLSDAMAIATAVLKLEQSPGTAGQEEQLPLAQEILSDLLRGKYNSPQDPRDLPDLSQRRMAYQLGRIFLTVPGSLQDLATEIFRGTERSYNSITVTPNAFNIILEGVVERFGPVAGKKLWERWCQKPDDRPREGNPNSDFVASSIHGPRSNAVQETERIVTPTQTMLRSILRPILQKIQPEESDHKQTTSKESLSKATENPNSNSKTPFVAGIGEDRTPESTRKPLAREEQSILEWGAGMFKKFGLSPPEIREEMPAFVSSKPGRRKQNDVASP